MTGSITSSHTALGKSISTGVIIPLIWFTQFSETKTIIIIEHGVLFPDPQGMDTLGDLFAEVKARRAW
jgi:hypothetical protein